MERREFIDITSKTICACSLGVTGILLKGCSDNDSMLVEPQGLEITFDLNEEGFQDLKVNGGSVVTPSNELESKGLLLYRNNEIISAYANRCTHASYKLTPFNDSGLSFCVGHGAQFNTEGVPVTGPATRSLREFETLLENDILTVFG